MKGIKAFSLLLLALSTLVLDAQDTNQQDGDPQNQQQNRQQPQPSQNATEEEGPRNFWQVSLPGGHYMVGLNRIASVSMHEYLLDGTLVVNEVTVDAGGRGLARFYHITPTTGTSQPAAVRLLDRGKEFIDRAARRGGLETHNMAQKNYPATTHAGTVEYRVHDLRDLDALYNSLQQAWESGSGRKLTIR